MIILNFARRRRRVGRRNTTATLVRHSLYNNIATRGSRRVARVRLLFGVRIMCVCVCVYETYNMDEDDGDDETGRRKQ